MAFVLDCSVAMAWVFPDEATESTGRLRDSLIDGRAFVPSLWPVEVASVLLAATRRGRLGAEEWPRVCASLEALPIEIDPVSMSRARGERCSISPWSTAYPPTTPCIWSLLSGCGYRSPHWTVRSPPRHEPRVWARRRPRSPHSDRAADPQSCRTGSRADIQPSAPICASCQDWDLAIIR